MLVAVRTTSKSSLFLIELIIVILFFSIASYVCISLFADARLTSIESNQLTMAVTYSQNAVEALRAVGEDDAELESLIGVKKNSDGNFAAEYDKDWNLVGDNGKYRLLMDINTDNAKKLITGEISVAVIDNGAYKNIYSVATSQYRP